VSSRSGSFASMLLRTFGLDPPAFIDTADDWYGRRESL
jgi:hypothetical protein